MINYLLIAALIIIALSVLLCMYRLVKGPSIPDRITALDTIGINILAMIAVLCVLEKTRVYTDIILMIGILSFIGTVVFSRYMERGVVIEHGDDK